MSRAGIWTLLLLAAVSAAGCASPETPAGRDLSDKAERYGVQGSEPDFYRHPAVGDRFSRVAGGP